MKSISSTESAFFSSDSSIANKWKYWLTTDTKYIKPDKIIPDRSQNSHFHKFVTFTLPLSFTLHERSLEDSSLQLYIFDFDFFFLEFLKKHFFDLHEALICFNKAYFKFFGVQILLTFQFFFHLNWRRGGCQVYFKQHLKVSIW